MAEVISMEEGTVKEKRKNGERDFHKTIVGLRRLVDSPDWKKTEKPDELARPGRPSFILSVVDEFGGKFTIKTLRERGNNGNEKGPAENVEITWQKSGEIGNNGLGRWNISIDNPTDPRSGMATAECSGVLVDDLTKQLNDHGQTEEGQEVFSITIQGRYVEKPSLVVHLTRNGFLKRMSDNTEIPGFSLGDAVTRLNNTTNQIENIFKEEYSPLPRRGPFSRFRR